MLLRLPDWGSTQCPNWYIACYAKGWDYNPWYVAGVHKPHPKKRWAQHQRENGHPDPRKKFDDLFSL